MSPQLKHKRRGFIMTGGGAKGLYEAGVIQAFHLTGMEFDVITGSSIGAMNAVFFAEYQLSRKQLLKEKALTAEEVIEAMEQRVRAYHHAWLTMPEKHLIDDGPNSALGRLAADLAHFHLDFSDLVELGWWASDPDRQALPSPTVWPALLRLLNALVKRLGGTGTLLKIYKENPGHFVDAVLRSYLRQFDLEKSLIPAGDDRAIYDIFTQPIDPLRAEDLASQVTWQTRPGSPTFRLVDPKRMLREYAEEQIDLRLTRANFRTGRLEVSAYLSLADFVRYMEKQGWRLDVSDPEKMPLGSFRLQLPGNPSAIQAALASGRFPGVFAPFPFRLIYPQEDAENRLLHRFLKEWFGDAQVQQEFQQAFMKMHPESEALKTWQQTLERWRSSNIRTFFPRPADGYVDGGSIDNTPSNSAVDATREWIDAHGQSRRATRLDLYVVYLSPEPRLAADLKDEPAIHEVVQRTLAIQGAAKETSDAVVVDTINTFGKRAEDLGETLLALIEILQSSAGELSASQRQELAEALRKAAAARGQRGYLGESGEGILERIEAWASEIVCQKLPVHIEEIKIYPEKMTLSTLQFTPRLGYRQDHAIQMITMGCHNTLWALRSRLETAPEASLDALDRQALALARQWMGNPSWPSGAQAAREIDKLRQEWACQRSSCVFHASHCQHGKKIAPNGGS